MKNLVKQAKSKLWMSIVVGISMCIITYLIMYLVLPTPIYHKPEDAPLMIIYYMIIFGLIPMMSAFIGLLSYVFTKEKIWSDIKKHKKEISLTRHIHHLRMIEKYVELGDKEKSELLFNQYIDSKYLDQNCASFFEGAIRSKFYNKLDFKIICNGEEI